MHGDSYSSGEEGQISWPFYQESALPLDPELNTPIIPKRKKRRRKTQISNLDLIVAETNSDNLQYDRSRKLSIPVSTRVTSPIRKLPSSAKKYIPLKSVSFNEGNTLSELCTPENLHISPHSCKRIQLKCLNITDCASYQYKYLQETAVNSILITKKKKPVQVRKLDISTLPHEKSTSICFIDEKAHFKGGDKFVDNLRNNKELDLTSRPSSPILSSKRKIVISPSGNKIVQKVNTYFENYFSSQTNSQVSIECSHNSTDIPKTQFDIMESRSPSLSQQSEVKIAVEVSLSSKNSTENSPDSVTEKFGHSESKLICKYKKDGLSDRLQILIKKHRNKIMMWHHEKYLANKSKFVPPNTENVKEFSITKIYNDYNMYLIEAQDCSNDSICVILVNVNHEGSETLKEDCLLKLYEPYEEVKTQYGIVFLNLCKFECFGMDKKLI